MMHLLAVADFDVQAAVKLAVLVPHVTAAVAAILFGLAALFSPKPAKAPGWWLTGQTFGNRSVHRFCGRIYVVAMGIVCVTAFPLVVWRPNAALLELSVLSFGLAFTGPRFMKPRLKQSGFCADNVVRGLLMLSMPPAVYFGVLDMQGGNVAQGVATFIMGMVALLVGWTEMSWHKPLAPTERLTVHVTHMVWSYTLIVTVALVLGLPALPAGLRWFTLPTLVLVSWLYLRYVVRLGRRSNPQ